MGPGWWSSLTIIGGAPASKMLQFFILLSLVSLVGAKPNAENSDQVLIFEDLSFWSWCHSFSVSLSLFMKTTKSPALCHAGLNISSATIRLLLIWYGSIISILPGGTKWKVASYEQHTGHLPRHPAVLFYQDWSARSESDKSKVLLSSKVIGVGYDTLVRQSYWTHVGQIWNQFWCFHLVVKFWTNTSGTTHNWPNLEPMQVEFYLAGEITQVIDSIPWVRCASVLIS